MAGTLAEKVWESHIVHRAEGEPDLLYVDLHLVHEAVSYTHLTLPTNREV